MGKGDELHEMREELSLLQQEMAEIRRVVQPGGIFLTDGEGRPRVSISLDENGRPSIQIWNENRRVVLSLGQTEEGAGMAFVASAGGQPRAGMKVNDLGGVVSALGSDGAVKAVMLGQDSGGELLIANGSGVPVAKVGVVDEQGMVHVNERTGRPMAYMMCGGERGVVAVHSETGDEAAALCSDENGGALIFYDDEGKPQSSLPVA